MALGESVGNADTFGRARQSVTDGSRAYLRHRPDCHSCFRAVLSAETAPRFSRVLSRRRIHRGVRRRASARIARKRRISSICSPDRAPCFHALRLPRGAPLPFAAPCIRHRFFPLTAGDWHAVPLRVVAKHRGAAAKISGCMGLFGTSSI